jgi:hypothetical protein
MMGQWGEVYEVSLAPSSRVTLTQVHGAMRIDESAWLEFAGETVQDPSLTGTQPAVLRARWAAGNASVVINDGKIVSYASFVQLYTSQTRGIVSSRYGVACAGIRPAEMDSHRWQECVHYWVSDAPVVYSLNEELRQLTAGDISGWRRLLTMVALESVDAPGLPGSVSDQNAKLARS